jgi:hypothetical protein
VLARRLAYRPNPPDAQSALPLPDRPRRRQQPVRVRWVVPGAHSPMRARPPRCGNIPPSPGIRPAQAVLAPACRAHQYLGNAVAVPAEPLTLPGSADIRKCTAELMFGTPTKAGSAVRNRLAASPHSWQASGVSVPLANTP